MQLIHDRYEMGPALGSGAMADVFEAYDHRLQRRVAIKCLKADGLDATARSRFEHEALAGASLTHPNAAAIYDYAADEHPPFLVMELVEGPTLAQYLRQRGPRPVDEALSITGQILGALGAAHALGIVHRDVKPANVMFAGKGTVKLVDFGIAKSIGGASDATATGMVVGTPRYLSPEQLSGEAATPRSDLYAAGLVLYEMLAGGSPFASAAPEALAPRDAPIPSLAERRPGLPGSVYAAVERALAEDPAQRFDSASAMRDALRLQAQGDDTVSIDAVDPTRTSVAPILAPTVPDRRRRRGSVRWMIAAALVAAAAIAGFAIARSGDDQGTTTAAVPAGPTTVPSTLAMTTVPPSPTTVGVQAGSVPELIALLEGHPGAFGSASGDLLEELQRLLEHPDRNGHQVQRLQDDIDAWVSSGELDPRIGALATGIFAQYQTPDAGGDVGKRDKGEG